MPAAIKSAGEKYIKLEIFVNWRDTNKEQKNQINECRNLHSKISCYQKYLQSIIVKCVSMCLNLNLILIETIISFEINKYYDTAV